MPLNLEALLYTQRTSFGHVILFGICFGAFVFFILQWFRLKRQIVLAHFQTTVIVSFSSLSTFVI